MGYPMPVIYKKKVAMDHDLFLDIINMMIYHDLPIKHD